jgi:hypothetical protein
LKEKLTLLEYIEKHYYKEITLRRMNRKRLLGIEDKVIEKTNKFDLFEFQEFYKYLKRYDCLFVKWDEKKVVFNELKKQNKDIAWLANRMKLEPVVLEKSLELNTLHLKDYVQIAKILDIPTIVMKELSAQRMMLKLNPDKEYRKNILKKIKENDNYCCCQLEKTKNSLCSLVFRDVFPEQIHFDELCYNGAKEKQCFCNVYIK